MEELYNLGISHTTILNMLEQCPNIKNMTINEIKEKIEILKKINCCNYQIVNIISSNPLYLDKTNENIIKLINKLNTLKFDTLNILFDSNPYILNLETFEIDNYISTKINNGENLENIIEDLDSNPYLFDSI